MKYDFHWSSVVGGNITAYITPHCGPEQPKIQSEVLGDSLVRSLIRLHRSLVRLLRSARFARSFAHFAHSLARGYYVCFFPFSTISHLPLVPAGPFTDVVDICITPSEGEIGPREQRHCRLDFVSRLVGPLSGLRVACQVDGMGGKPVYLALSAHVNGLSVSLATTDGEENSGQQQQQTADPLQQPQQQRNNPQQQQPNNHLPPLPPGGIPIFKAEEQESLRIDFGSTCKLGATVKRYLWLRNDTAIAAPFRVEIDHFRATSQLTLEEVTPPPATPIRATSGGGGGGGGASATAPGMLLRRSGVGPRGLSSTSRRPILEKTANLGDAKSKTRKKAYEDLCQSMLQHGRGIAIQASPQTGMLGPYAELCVELTAYNDMWGNYEDVVIVVVGKYTVLCTRRVVVLLFCTDGNVI